MSESGEVHIEARGALVWVKARERGWQVGSRELGVTHPQSFPLAWVLFWETGLEGVHKGIRMTEGRASRSWYASKSAKGCR